MELLDKGENTNTGALNFEKFNKLRYLGAVLGTKDYWVRKICLRIIKAERASFALSKLLKSQVFSKKTKTRQIIRPTITYEYEA